MNSWLARCALLGVLGGTLALAVLAVPVSAKSKAASQKAERAYIETSYLIAPRKLGKFTLEKASYDPANKYAGAGFRYVVEGHQETRIDVYVYPSGRSTTEQALQRGLQMFEQDMKSAAKAGIYANVVTEAAADFVIEPVLEAEPAPPANDFDAKVIATIADAERMKGSKVSATLELKPQGWPMHSSMHLFYKQLYFFKVRASAAQQRIAITDFNALVDEAARVLVPAIEAAHVGDCANPTITLHPDADTDPEQGALELLTQVSVVQSYNCHLSAKDAEIERKSADAEVVEIAYQASEWKSE